MGNLSYLDELGKQMGFSVLPNARTFNSDYQHGKGIVLGRQDGYLVAVGLIATGNNKSLGVLVRYRSGSPREAIETTLKDLPVFKGFAGRKTLKVTNGGVAAAWPYAFKKPTIESVLAFVDEILSHIRGVALPFSGKCEDCNSHDVADVTLMSGIPGYHCLSCQSRMTAEKMRAAEEYQNRPANYLLGVPVGILAAAVAGTAWGLLISALEAGTNSWTPKLHAIIAIGVGGLVAWTMFKVMGKITLVGQGIAIFLTLAGKFWGDALFYTLDVLYGRGAHISVNLLSWTARDFQVFKTCLNLVLHHFWVFKLYGFERKLVLAGDLAFAFCLPWFPWGKIPKFVPTFESVGKVPERQQRQLGAHA